jgi:hypothetical protein
MVKAGKIFIWVVSGAGILLVLLAALALILPHILDAGAIGRNVAAELDARYHIRAEKVDIVFLPSPRMTMLGVKTTIAETQTVTADAVSIYPKILPLLVGKLAPAEIELLNPMITAMVPEQLPEHPSKSLSQRLQRFKDIVPQVHAAILEAMNGVVIEVRNGGLQLCCGDNHVLLFEEIDLRTSVHAQRVDFELTSGKSALWQALTFSGWLDTVAMKGSAELNLTGGNPKDLLRHLNAPEFDEIGDSQIDLSVALSTGGPKNFHADFTASVQQLNFEGSPQSLAMSNGSLSGAFAVDQDGIDFSLSRFRFDYPRVSLTANYVERYRDESVTLNIEGRETDVGSIKSFILAANKHDPVIRRVFQIIREAEVPEVLFSARAKSPSELINPQNFTVRGSIENGVVFVPKPNLNISDVRGNLVIEGGVLDATNLSGHTAGSSTSNATLRIGLKEHNAPFHMDIPLEADLSELPDVLRRVVDNEQFRHELTLIKDVTGKAQGKLILGESLDDVMSKVESGAFHLYGRYGRLPEPVDLEGSSFLFEGSKISAAALAGKSGKSSIAGVDISYDWGTAKLLQIESKAKSVVSMDILGPYMRANEYWKTVLDGPPKGILVLDSLRFSGWPSDPSKRQFDASGSVEEVVFQNKQLNGPLNLKTGGFEINGQEIVLNAISAVLADSALSISGKITGYLEQPRKVDLQLSGRLGPEGNKIVASLAGLPPSIRAISNLNLLSSRLTLDKEPKAAFHGEMQFPDGPDVMIDLIKTPRELSINNLTVKDKNSDAAMSITTGDNLLQIGFSGKLSNKTVDLLIVDNKFLRGPMEGKFNARIYPDTPDKSTVQGVLKVAGLQLPANLPVSMPIENAAMEGDGNKINVQSAMISWDGSKLNLAGSIARTGDAYIVDMNASADSLDLDSIIKSRDNLAREMENAAQPGADRPKKAWEAPIQGTIRVKCQQLSYGKLVWNPADADVLLGPGSIDVRLSQANLCGISTPGDINITPQGLSITLKPSAEDQDLQAALMCFFNKQHILSGSYTLKGNLAARGKDDNLMESLEGNLEFKAKEGRIFRFNTFSKIISLLSITEFYRGVLPDLMHEGCAYHTIESQGKIKNGKLVLSDSVIDGPCIKMVFHGEIDMVRRKVDLIALVAPLRTVERVVGAAPVMGKILNESLVTLPVKISGDLEDPNVVLLSPSAVGEELFDVMKKVFKLPLAIFQPERENEAAHNTDASKQ